MESPVVGNMARGCQASQAVRKQRNHISFTHRKQKENSENKAKI